MSSSVTTSSAFTGQSEARFVSLTTYRKSGEPVSTPVWIGRDGDALIVTTPQGSGKVKRLRHDPRVELRPCSRRGHVEDGVEAVSGVAEILTDHTVVERLTNIFRAKYGFEYPLFMGIERLLKRGRKEERFILRITPA